MQYKQIIFEERKVIQKMVWRGKTCIEISRELHRDPSTIYRELKRNRSEDDKMYRSVEAHEKALERKKRNSLIGAKIQNNEYLLLYIVEKLFYKWTPEQISARLKIKHPGDRRNQISHETLYLWLYWLFRNIDVELYKLLPKSKRKRRKRCTKRERRIIIKGKKSIHARPEEANNRTSIGHWEGDTIVGNKNEGYAVTLVDRKSRFLTACKMENKSAESCARAVYEAFSDIPNNRINTITFDNGSEFALFKSIEESCECSVYFADPYCAWQRGTNENTNGLLRRYLPKSISLKNLHENELNSIVKLLNNRPRKVLNYLTPFEVFYNNSIALQT